MTETVDPMGGSYYLESLTDDIEEQVTGYLETIKGFGDTMIEAVIHALEEGFFYRELSDASYRYHKEVEKGEKVIVGINKFQEEETLTPVIFRADPTARERQTERLKEIRAQRDNRALEGSLMRLAEAIDKDENLFPYVLDAVKRDGTLGEITKIMTDVYGRYRDPGIY